MLQRVDRLLVMQAGRLCAQGPAADPAVRQVLAEVFDHAFSIERLATADGARWVAVPVLGEGA